MNLALILVAIIAFGGATAGAYMQGRQDGADKERAENSREVDIAAQASEAAASAAATAISRIKVQNRTIQNEVQREISERVVYRDCVHSPDQLQRINAALAGGDRPKPAGGGQLPGTDTAR